MPSAAGSPSASHAAIKAPVPPRRRPTGTGASAPAPPERNTSPEIHTPSPRLYLGFPRRDTSPVGTPCYRDLKMLFHAMDLAATFVFALSGAMQGVKSRLDLFGVLVVAYAAAVSGGIARDLLIGAVPPVAIADWRYVAVAAVAGLAGFCASDALGRLKTPALLVDAARLCLFAVTGTQKALAFGL